MKPLDTGMTTALRPTLRLFVLVAALCRAADCAAADDVAGRVAVQPVRMEFWRDADGTLTGGDNAATLVRSMERTELTADTLPGANESEETFAYVNMGQRSLRVMPQEEFNTFAGSAAMRDRGIDSADTRWRRQARITGMQMRMLNGPQGTLYWDGLSSGSEQGHAVSAGAVVPLNPRWELAVLNRFATYELKDNGNRAGLDALTLRIGANPSVSFRPWFEVTPYVGLKDRDGGGIGFAGGLSKSWSSGISLEGEAYAFRPWDEGYETNLHDGRSHGLRVAGTLPVSRRFTLTGEADYEWLELGPNAPGGGENAGKRGGFSLRADYVLMKRDGCYMGYGFREERLWNEQLVPVELGVYADLSWQRYIRPRGFTALNPAEKSRGERVGVYYYQAVSPKLGFNAEAYIGRDVERDIGAGEMYGFAARVNVVFGPALRGWAGWGYDSSSDSIGGGGPNRNFSAGLTYNF